MRDLSREQIEAGYEALFDERTRAAHFATIASAAATVPDRGPTVSLVHAFARVFEVSAAELGGFFGLLLQSDGRRELWVDVARSQDCLWLARSTP